MERLTEEQVDIMKVNGTTANEWRALLHVLNDIASALECVSNDLSFISDNLKSLNKK